MEEAFSVEGMEAWWRAGGSADSWRIKDGKRRDSKDIEFTTFDRKSLPQLWIVKRIFVFSGKSLSNTTLARCLTIPETSFWAFSSTSLNVSPLPSGTFWLESALLFFVLEEYLLCNSLTWFNFHLFKGFTFQGSISPLLPVIILLCIFLVAAGLVLLLSESIRKTFTCQVKMESTRNSHVILK